MLFKNEKGFSLIEILIALAILSVVAVSIMYGVMSSIKSADSIEKIDAGRAIAESQIENIKKQTFNTSGNYTVSTDLTAEYPKYTISIPQALEIDHRDAFIQKIVVIVSYSGKEVARLEDYKVKP